MKLTLVYCLPVFLFLILSSCDTNEPLPQGAVGLTLEEVSCTEAWITLTVGNLPGTAYIRITNNGNLIETLDVNATETLLYYDTLQPNTNYEFQAFSSLRGEDIDGNKLQVTTLDTTSHNFTWQTFTFGEHSSSTLYDVAIIDETNIWAVGEIYMNDSLGNPDSKIYNAVHWNGNIWEPKRIKTLFGGNLITVPLDGIFAFSATDIWMVGSLPIHGDGANWTMYDLRSTVDPNLSLSKAWGNSSNDIYFGGRAGSIAHYENGRWRKIESGTTTNINDVWGLFENGTSTVYCPVSSVFNPPQDKKILKITSDKVDSISWKKDSIVYSCWTKNKNFLYVGGEGVFVNKLGTWEQVNLPAITTNSIRGNDINDIFTVGSIGTIFHFNGINWKVISSYNNKENYRVDIKNNVVAIGGYYNGKGFVEIGRRN